MTVNTLRSRVQEIISILCVLEYSFFFVIYLTPHRSLGAVRDGNWCTAASGTSVSQLAKGNMASLELRYRILWANETA